jgi:hypothetical protein
LKIDDELKKGGKKIKAIFDAIRIPKEILDFGI